MCADVESIDKTMSWSSDPNSDFFFNLPLPIEKVVPGKENRSKFKKSDPLYHTYVNTQEIILSIKMIVEFNIYLYIFYAVVVSFFYSVIFVLGYVLHPTKIRFKCNAQSNYISFFTVAVVVDGNYLGNKKCNEKKKKYYVRSLSPNATRCIDKRGALAPAQNKKNGEISWKVKSIEMEENFKYSFVRDDSICVCVFAVQFSNDNKCINGWQHPHTYTIFIPWIVWVNRSPIPTTSATTTIIRAWKQQQRTLPHSHFILW